MSWYTGVRLILLHSIFIETLQLSIATVNVTNYRLPNDTIPIHYDVRLNPRMSDFNNYLVGEIKIDFKVTKATSDVVLHSSGLTIDELATSIENGSSTFKPKEHVYDESTDKLRLHFEHTLQRGMYTLNMKFKGEVSNYLRGFFVSHYEDGNNQVPFLATHFQKTTARRAFPCWDEPALKATFNISLKHFDNYTALSNMPVSEVEYDATDGKYWTRFETTPVMSTNILAFVISDFKHISNSNGTINVWANKHAITNLDYFMMVIEKAAMALTEYLNSTVRVPKMDHVIFPEYSARATENWGLITYMDYAVPRDTDTQYVGHRAANVMTVTHELSHQWFGNLVSPSWWTYFWMSEGMATYLKFLITDRLFKDWRLMDSIIREQLVSFAADDSSSAVAVNKDIINPKEPGRSVIFVYAKPCVIFWMLSHMVGEEEFRAGLINYIDVHQYSSVTSDDLWAEMQNALNRSVTPHLEFQVKAVMDTWIEQAGYPLVTVTRNYTTGDAIVRQEAATFGMNRTRKEWWIPINYATKSNPDFSITRPMHFLKPGDEHIVIEGIGIDGWVIVNLQQTGYYRVNYDETNWRRIAEYLNNGDHKKIPVGNRIQLLDTAFKLLQSRQISPDIFLKLSNYLCQETDGVVWNYVISILKKLEKYTRSPTGGEALKSHILGLMNGFLKSINYNEIFSATYDFAKVTKFDALELACSFGDTRCKAEAAARLKAYLENPEANRIPDVAEFWVFSMGLAQANQTTWDQLIQLKNEDREAKTDILSSYLNCAENTDVFMHYLNVTLMENRTTSEFANIINLLLGRYRDIEANIDAKIDFVIRNFEILKSVTDRPENIFEALIWSSSRQDQLDKLKTFLRGTGINCDSDINNHERALQKTESEVTEILQWLKNVRE